MSLPRELFLDSGGALRSRPARELDGARRATLVSRPVDGRGSVPVALSARSGQAAEFSVTPAGPGVTAVGLRLAGPDVADVRIRVTAGGVEITEGGRRLTEAAGPLTKAVAPLTEGAGPPADGAVGQVRVYYDGGIVEVFSTAAPAAAVICDRDGRYDRVDVEISGPPGAPPGQASLTAWSCG
jgi:hypothetical protein